MEQLGWHPRERRTDFRLPMDAIDGLRLVSGLQIKDIVELVLVLRQNAAGQMHAKQHQSQANQPGRRQKRFTSTAAQRGMADNPMRWRYTHLFLPCPASSLQASRLTSLSLTAPSPANIPAFFDSLACLTGLRSLSIGVACEDGCVTLFNAQAQSTPCPITASGF